MNAGDFDVRIVIQKATNTVSSTTGARVQSWSNYATVWAKRFEQTSGSEVVNADRRENKQMYVFTIRYNSAVTVRDRILHDSQYFNIINIAQVRGRNMYLELLAELTQ